MRLSQAHCPPRIFAPALWVLLAVAGCDGIIDPTASAPTPPPAAPAALTPEQARAQAIQQTLQSLQQEYRDHGSDWHAWSQQLEPFRAALQARIAATPPLFTHGKGILDNCRMIETFDAPPLFLGWPEGYARHALEPDSIEPFRHELPVVTVARWLKSQGIDLIFVPVPMVVEVYPERLAKPCPADRIVAPHLRRLLLELLQHDVEVVDLLPAFLAADDRNGTPLYLPDDPHWAPRGKQMAAALLRERLQRYAFVQQALRQRPQFEVLDLPSRDWPSSLAGALTAEQQHRCEPAQPRTNPRVIGIRDSDVIDQHAPVLFIGDSFSFGTCERVAQEINCSVALCTGALQTIQAIVSGLRDPSVFRGRTVVVWTVCNPQLTLISRWQLPSQLTPYASAPPRRLPPAKE